MGFLSDLKADPIGVGSHLVCFPAIADAPVSTKVGELARNGVTFGYHETTPTPWVLSAEPDRKFGCAQLNLDLVQSAAGRKDPCYYLPWGENQVYRLKPSLREPIDIFFTAPLNGCVIIVEGTPTAPIIYHANAMGIHSDSSPLADPQVPEAVALRQIEDRNNAMYAAYRSFPGLTSFSDSQSAGSVTALEYGVLVGRPSEDAEKRALRSNLQQPNWLRRAGFSAPPAAVNFRNSSGSVFGVRNRGNWSFYSQKVIDTEKYSMVLSCSEFWPNGFNRPPA